MLKGLASDGAFKEVPASVLQGLVERAEIRTARKSETIYAAGEHWGRLGFVIEGSLAMLVQGEDGKGHLYEHADAGEFFGVSAMFDGKAEMAQTIVVSTKALVALVDRTAALSLCKEHGTLAVAFAMTLAGRVRRTTSLLAEQLNLTAHERIARYLLSFAGGPGLSPALDPLPLMTQAQIGAAAGTVKDVAARAIGAFERQGALKRERGHVKFLDREKLEKLGRVGEQAPYG